MDWSVGLIKVKRLHEIEPYATQTPPPRSNLEAMHLARRQRLRIILAVILCLLFQQVATAAYACTLTSMPPDPVEMAEECSQMGMQVAQDSPALCAKHCSPDQAVTPDTGFAHVPPLALPPVHFEARALPHVTHQVLAGRVRTDHPGPPPRLRYCSLLI